MVEGARLESVYAGNRIAGSNPASSANSRLAPTAVADFGPRYDGSRERGAAIVAILSLDIIL